MQWDVTSEEIRFTFQWGCDWHTGNWPWLWYLCFIFNSNWVLLKWVLRLELPQLWKRHLNLVNGPIYIVSAAVAWAILRLWNHKWRHVIQFSWYMTLCHQVTGSWHSRGTQCLHCQGFSDEGKMQCHISEDWSAQSQCCGSIQSHNSALMSLSVSILQVLQGWTKSLKFQHTATFLRVRSNVVVK